jgi:hypothetical protein
MTEMTYVITDRVGPQDLTPKQVYDKLLDALRSNRIGDFRVVRDEGVSNAYTIYRGQEEAGWVRIKKEFNRDSLQIRTTDSKLQQYIENNYPPGKPVEQEKHLRESPYDRVA